MKPRFTYPGTVQYGVSIPKAQLPSSYLINYPMFTDVGRRCPGITVAYFDKLEEAQQLYYSLIGRGLKPNKTWENDVSTNRKEVKMSQHTTLSKFVTAKGVELEVEVLMGWDMPLQRHFLVVDVTDSDLAEDDIPEAIKSTASAEEGIIYSNLFDANEDKDLQYFQNKLAELGIKVPDSMIGACHSDRLNNAGNGHTTHE